MPSYLDLIQINISKAADGSDYVQVSSVAAFPVNIVLVAGKIEVVDNRPQLKEKKR